MSNCKEVEIICTKIQYREATITEKIRIRVHLLICHTCRTFSKKNHKLSLLCKDAHFRTLPLADKEKMKKNLGSMN
ncbi:MAG TPA: hypothetical protein VKZ93_07475 [Arenibacter sp.]|nr:hypothetical protein [Arenibacter sp.]